MQKNWKRIWNGYVTWATAGFLGTDTFMRRLIIDKKRINIGTPEAPNCIPDLAGYFRDQMLALVRRKAPFAKQVHGGVAIGGKPLNVLFDNPEDLLKLLVSEKLVDPKHPRDSKLIALMQFEGPMYRVFSDKEQAVVLDWIELVDGDAYECIAALPDSPGGDPATEVMNLIARHAGQAMTAHGGITLTTRSGKQRPLASLFDQPSELMGALVASGWVSPGQPQRSFFLTRILQAGGPMQGIFSSAEITAVSDWIQAGAEMPSERSLMMAAATKASADFLHREADKAAVRGEAALDWHGIGALSAGAQAGTSPVNRSGVRGERSASEALPDFEALPVRSLARRESGSKQAVVRQPDEVQRFDSGSRANEPHLESRAALPARRAMTISGSSVRWSAGQSTVLARSFIPGMVEKPGRSRKPSVQIPGCDV